MSITGFRDGIAAELQRAVDQVIGLLAGLEAERLFTVAPLPGTEHDLDRATGLICRSCSSGGP
jgi:hypothetical protein